MPVAHVIAVHMVPEVNLEAGQSCQVRVQVEVKEGYHVQANPAGGTFLIPMRVELKSEGSVRVGRPVYPPGRPYRLPGTSADLMTYSGTFEIVVPLKVEKDALTRGYSLQGEISFQACDERTCLFPDSVQFELPLRVVSTMPALHA